MPPLQISPKGRRPVSRRIPNVAPATLATPAQLAGVAQ